MTPLALAAFTAACVFAGAMIGLALHRVLPAAHLSKETQDVVRLGTGMLSVLSSLVLGLLIGTAKTTYDTTDRAMQSYSARLIFLDEILRDYGDPARMPRYVLRRYTAQILDDIWPETHAAAGVAASVGQQPEADHPVQLDNRNTGAMMERVRELVRALRPGDDGQKWLQDQALTVSSDLLQQRWLLIQNGQRSVSPLVLAILVSWVTCIFASFGLNAPRNGTVVAAFLVCSLAIGGSVYLVQAMDDPFSGALKISGWPMANALSHMAPTPK